MRRRDDELSDRGEQADGLPEAIGAALARLRSRAARAPHADPPRPEPASPRDDGQAVPVGFAVASVRTGVAGTDATVPACEGPEPVGIGPACCLPSWTVYTR